MLYMSVFNPYDYKNQLFGKHNLLVKPFNLQLTKGLSNSQ